MNIKKAPLRFELKLGRHTFQLYAYDASDLITGLIGAHLKNIGVQPADKGSNPNPDPKSILAWFCHANESQSVIRRLGKSRIDQALTLIPLHVREPAPASRGSRKQLTAAEQAYQELMDWDNDCEDDDDGDGSLPPQQLRCPSSTLGDALVKWAFVHIYFQVAEAFYRGGESPEDQDRPASIRDCEVAARILRECGYEVRAMDYGYGATPPWHL